jgi:hypothetical protein
MAINYNEDGIPDFSWEDDKAVWLMIGDIENYLDEHYKHATRPLAQRVGEFLVSLYREGCLALYVGQYTPKHGSRQDTEF